MREGRLAGFWEGVGRAGLQRSVSVPSPGLGSGAGVRAEEQFHCKAQTAFTKASPRVQSTVCEGENPLWSPFITQSRTEPDGEQKPVALPRGPAAQRRRRRF